MKRLLALVALVSGVGFALAAPASAALRVAILSDDLPGLERTLVEHVRGLVAATGAEVTLLAAPQLADPAVLDRTRQEVLILTHSPVFPGTARDNVQRFLEAGGHLVLMGGFAYERPLCRVQGAWRDQADFARLLAELPATQTLFTFEDGALAAWQRGTNKPEHPSQASLVPGPTGQGLRLDIRDVGPWQWDMWSTNLPAPPAAGCDLLLLRARAGERTPEVYVEVDEADGARWTLRVPLTTQWARYALEAARFRFLKDGSPKHRGGPGDRLDLSRARRLSLGLASGKDGVPPGDHWLELDDLGVARNTLGVSVADFRAPNNVCFDTYEPYVLCDIQRVTPVGHKLPPPLTMPLSGLSAVGFTLWDRSELVPLLQAHDRQGRPRGWAASQLIHYGGAYQGGCWLLSGVTTSGFYRTPTFDRTLTEFLKGVAGGRLPEEAAGRNERERQRTLGPYKTAPESVKISPDGHFVYPDGRRFFMIGANYIGSLDRKFFGGPWLAWLERDFQTASQAGINCLRVYGASALYRDPVKLAALKETARLHNIRLLIVVVDHTNLLTREELQARAREVATAFADEPMLLGYDLQNEPYLYEVAKVKDGTQTLGERYPLWQRWGEYEKAANLGGPEHFTSFPGVTGPLAPSAEWATAVQAASNVFGDWIRWQVEAIRRVDQTHPITVGYNSVFATLPCNAQLDFISHHGYEKPVDLAAVERNLTTMDRLHALWPGKPVSFGEFGYTNGMALHGQYLDLHTSAVGEFLHWLYAWNQGYEGCLKWVLMDHPLELSRQQCSWLPPDDLAKHIDQGRYGLFHSAGTATPQPKPLASALFFLRRHMTPWAKRGELQLVKADNALGTGYVYRAPDALFIGNTTYRSADLSFTAKAPANVLLRWGPGLEMVSTADATVRLKPGRFRKGLSGKVTGNVAWVRRQGDWVELALLEGQPVYFGE